MAEHIAFVALHVAFVAFQLAIMALMILLWLLAWPSWPLYFMLWFIELTFTLHILVDPGGRGVGEVKEAPTHKLRVGAINAHTGNAQNSVR